jgi:hypothetical protein
LDFLDGHEEYNNNEHNQIYTAELMRQMYPNGNNSTCNNTTDVERGEGINNSTCTPLLSTSSSAINNVNLDDIDDETNLMILKFGSVMGQQDQQQQHQRHQQRNQQRNQWQRYQ